MTWHINSLGTLVQRWCFTIIMMISTLIFGSCVDNTGTELQECIKKTSVPLIIVLVIVFLKVSRRFDFPLFNCAQFRSVLIRMAHFQFRYCVSASNKSFFGAASWLA